MRDAIVMIAAMVGKLDAAAIQTHAINVGMPSELLPMVQAFSDGKVQTEEIIIAWIATGGLADE